MKCKPPLPPLRRVHKRQSLPVVSSNEKRAALPPKTATMHREGDATLVAEDAAVAEVAVVSKAADMMDILTDNQTTTHRHHMIRDRNLANGVAAENFTNLVECNNCSAVH
jgi:hypothetical protein